MGPTEAKLTKIAQAEDTFNLLEHIAWTDVVKPKLLHKKEALGKQLVDHLLGLPLPDGVTKEMIAGQIYGINEIIAIFELILTSGERAYKELNSKGIHVQG